MNRRKLSLDELGRMDVEQFRQAEKFPLVILLDNIRSAHNIGSIFRTADAFRVQKIVLCGISATPPNNEMHKTALGATESVEWQYVGEALEAVTNLRNQGYRIVTVEQTTGSIDLISYKPDIQQYTAIIFGNEIAGVSQQLIDISDDCIEIPQYGTKHSLNIAVSVGIVLWDFFNKSFVEKPADFKINKLIIQKQSF